MRFSRGAKDFCQEPFIKLHLVVELVFLFFDSFTPSNQRTVLLEAACYCEYRVHVQQRSLPTLYVLSNLAAMIYLEMRNSHVEAFTIHFSQSRKLKCSLRLGAASSTHEPIAS